jgi:glycosyltransferase involved in cell wall biosynthesis
MRAALEQPRVVHISPIAFGPDGTFGGGERYPTELARAMAEQTPTTLVTFGDRAHRAAEGRLSLRMLSTRAKWAGDELNPLSEQLATVVAGADVVHIHQWESVTANIATVLARAMGRRVFATDLGGSARNYWRRWRLHRLLDGLLSISDFATSFYPELRHKATTIYGGVDVDWFSPDPSGRRGDHALFVGRLLPHKGIDVLIEALDPKTRLRIVGRPYDGGYYDHLRTLAFGKSVEFVCDANDEQVRWEYRTAGALVLPSLHVPNWGPQAPRAELLGLTLLEAMSCGTPVVCTRTGGMPEVVDAGRTGLVVEPHDRLDLAAAIATTTGPDGAEMGRAARDWVERRFSWSAIAAHCLERYRVARAHSDPAL